MTSSSSSSFLHSRSSWGHWSGKRYINTLLRTWPTRCESRTWHSDRHTTTFPCITQRNSLAVFDVGTFSTRAVRSARQKGSEETPTHESGLVRCGLQVSELIGLAFHVRTIYFTVCFHLCRAAAPRFLARNRNASLLRRRRQGPDRKLRLIRFHSDRDSSQDIFRSLLAPRSVVDLRNKFCSGRRHMHSHKNRVTAKLLEENCTAACHRRATWTTGPGIISDTILVLYLKRICRNNTAII